MLFTEPLARTLGLEATLRGHRGCVNRLAWSQDGTLLASGSDDRQVQFVELLRGRRSSRCGGKHLSLASQIRVLRNMYASSAAFAV